MESIEEVVVFGSGFYNSTLFTLQHCPAERVTLYYPAFGQDSVTDQRMAHSAQFQTKVDTIQTRVHYLGALDYVRLLRGSSTVNSPFVFKEVRRKIEQADAVVLLEPHSFFSAQIAEVSRRLGRRLYTFSEASPNLTLLKWFPYRTILWRTVRLSTRLAACTRNALALYSSIPDAARKLIYFPINSIDTSRFFMGPQRRTDRPTVLFVGRLEPHKGLLTLLRALSIVSGSQPLRLHVVGKGSLSYLLNLEWGYPITHDEFVQEEGYPSVYREADLFCLPSESILRGRFCIWEEVYGIVALEAMASGTPVVVSDSGNLPSIAVDPKQVFQAGCVRDLASTLSRYLLDPYERARLGLLEYQKTSRFFSTGEIRARWAQLLVR